MPPPKKMKIGSVPAYIDREHNIEVTRQTVYNWIKRGINGEKLKCVRKAGTLYTTEEWVDDFLSRIGR